MTGSLGSGPGYPASVFATIASRARRTNLVRAAAIAATFDAAESGELDRLRWVGAERTAHQLAGSAGTFGFSEVSELASVLETFLHEAADSGAASPARLAEARRWLAELTDQLAGKPDPDLG